MKNYNEALDFIHSRKKFSGKLSLERIKALMERLGDPQRDLPCIHIAGTNGKGSTATMIASVLQKAGYKTGLFTSPFIHDFRERFMINGKMIPKDTLLELCKRVRFACTTLEEEGAEAANEFEIVTAVGFLYFAKENCDIAVIETGLGGRFDATNIIETPLASVICSISMDHTAILGDTIEKIASEKAGIIKEGCPAILYHGNIEAAQKVLEKACRNKNAPIYAADPAYLKSNDPKSNTFTYKEAEYTLSLQGPHQISNALTALETLFTLKNLGKIDFNEEQLQAGLRDAYIPARMEQISNEPPIYIDGGHNLEGIDALLKAMDQLEIKEPIIIFGMMQDKPYQYAIRNLALRAHAFIGIEAPLPRSIPAFEIRDIAEPFCESVHHREDYQEAADLAKELSEGRPIIACGSLYSAGEIKEALKKIFNIG